jgi:hypothetical protein
MAALRAHTTQASGQVPGGSLVGLCVGIAVGRTSCVSRRAVAAGGWVRSHRGHDVPRRRPLRGRLPATRAPLSAHGRGRALPDAHLGARSDVRGPVRRGARAKRLREPARVARAIQSLPGPPRSHPDVVPVPPPVPRPAARRAPAPRTRDRPRAQQPGDGRMSRQRPSRAGIAVRPRGREPRRRHTADRAARATDVLRHLAFPQIGERLFLSRNTIKSHAVAIYRKFGVSSRAEAIERAVELGLLEDSLYPARAKTALPG